MRRIIVVGTTGSGKTTLAQRLSERLGVPHVELDALYWEPNWTEASLDVFRARVARALTGEAWVVDGNYSKVRDIVWSRADTVVWLDFSLPLIFWQLLRRTCRRIFLRQELWSSNRERWQNFFTRDSLFVWALRTYRRRRREVPAVLDLPEYTHLALVRLRSPREVRVWLAAIATLTAGAGGPPLTMTHSDQQRREHSPRKTRGLGR